MSTPTLADTKTALDMIRRRLTKSLRRYGLQLHPKRLEYDIGVSNQIVELTKVVEHLAENIEALKEKRA